MQPRAARRLRARGSLLWGLAAFVGFQLGLGVAIALWIPELHDPLYSYKAARLRERVQSQPRPFTAVMLGTSRTTYGVRGDRLAGPLQSLRQGTVTAFNFGIAGGGAVTSRLTLDRLLADGVRPDLVLIEVFPPQFHDSKSAAEIQALQPVRLRQTELPLLARYGLSETTLRRDWWLSWPLPCWTRRYLILSRFAPALLPYTLRQDWFRYVDGNGWVDMPGFKVTPQGRRISLQAARDSYAIPLARFQPGGAIVRAFEELLDHCREENIPVVLVLMPEGEVFRSWYRPEGWREFRAYLNGIERDRGVPLIDAREWLAEDDFVDSHHMLPDAAARFSERLGECLARHEMVCRLMRPAPRVAATAADSATAE